MKVSSNWSHRNDFPQDEVANTDTILASLIYPRLLAFRDSDLDSFPADIQDERAWKQTLQKMIEAFGLLREHHVYSDEENARIKKGLALFARYFTCLWI